MKRLLMIVILFYIAFSLHAQQYTGTSGLIHVPSAEMDREGDARIGVHFLNKEFSPDNFSYNTTTHYVSVTPFSWVEIGYTCTIMKGMKFVDGEWSDGGYCQKDRYFSVKLQPLKEGRWWPALAVGSNDPYGTENKNAVIEDANGIKRYHVSEYFCNYYIAASKHLTLKHHVFGIHAAYRHWKRDYNSKWNGLVGGITYRPSFAKNLRAIAEYTGNEINIGVDCLLWKHLLLQAALQDGKYFSGGVCFPMNLF